MKHLAAIWTFRHFLLALVRLDLRMRYKRSVLGIGWSLLNPIAMTLVFTVVFSGLMGRGAREYAPFVLCGMAVWGFLQQAVVAGSRAFVANESYIRQSPLPFGIYPLRVVLGQAIHSLIALGVVIALIVILQNNLNAVRALKAVVPALLLMLVAAWAAATIVAFANVYFHDTQHILEVGSQILFFLTPIIYYRQVLDDRNLGWVVDLNPANLFMELIRAPLLTGQTPALHLYGSAAALTLVLVGLAAGTMAWLQKRVIFHL
jgi:ABC-type polysaccharide/polyol phosphate export permease